ncbi:MAG: hypothetical protein AAB606_05950 [Patescibacteria group bacterium]
MNQPHQPSRKQAVVFFFLTLVLAIGVYAWVFFLNKGTLRINGAFPFKVQVSGITKTCDASPCEITLEPRNHTIILQKEGFFPDKIITEVKRWSTVDATASFKFIPVAKELGEISFPFKSLPLRPPFLAATKLKNFPKETKDVIFSPSGSSALVVLGKEIYLYDALSGTTDKTDLLITSRPTWAGENIAILEDKASKQILQIIKNGKREVVVSFERPFKNPKILGDVGGKKILVAANETAGSSYYLVDLDQKTRKKINVQVDAKNPTWVGINLAFELGDVKTKRVILVNTETLEEFLLPAEDSQNIIEMDNGNIVFLSSSKQDSDQPPLGMSVAEAVEEATKKTFNPEKKGTSLFVVEFDFAKKTYKTLVEIPIKKGETVSRLTPYTKDGKIYFEKDGKLFEISLR